MHVWQDWEIRAIPEAGPFWTSFVAFCLRHSAYRIIARARLR